MEAGKETPSTVEKGSFDVVKLVAAFVGMFVLAWILLYPAFFIVEAIHQLGYAIAGVLYRGDLGNVGLDFSLIPWLLQGHVTILKGDMPAYRILAWPLSNFFLLPLLAIVMIVAVGMFKPKDLIRTLLAYFLELVAFFAGFVVFREAVDVANKPLLLEIASKQTAEFNMVFNGLVAVAAVIGVALMVFYLIKWLIDLIVGAGWMKKGDLWHPYVIAAVSLAVGVVVYLIPNAWIATYIPYLAFIVLGLAMFSAAAFPKKAEPAPA